jgi:LacI family transcriptional regulator
MGHRSIGYVQCEDRFVNVDLRKRGFTETLAQNRLTVDVFFTVKNRIDSAKETLYKFFEERNGTLPSAVFCETDYIAIGAVKALQELGIRVPEDISVIGFDDIPESKVLTPELTTIRVDKAAIGKLAVSRLAEVLKHETLIPAVKQIVDTHLVKRGSCAEYMLTS